MLGDVGSAPRLEPTSPRVASPFSRDPRMVGQGAASAVDAHAQGTSPPGL